MARSRRWERRMRWDAVEVVLAAVIVVVLIALAMVAIWAVAALYAGLS